MAQSRIPAPAVDPRQTGWPCGGRHVSSRERSNQYGRWTTCLKCGLRLTYKVKKGHGEARTLGTAPELVAMAQEELQMVYQASEVNEKIFQGKVMEIKGRQLVMSRGQGSVKTEIRADDPRAEALLNATGETGTTSRRSTTPTRTPTSRRSRTTPTPVPSTPTRQTRSLSPAASLAPSEVLVAAAKAKAKVKTAPRTPVAEREISEPRTPDWHPEIMEIHSDGSAEVVEDSRASGQP